MDCIVENIFIVYFSLSDEYTFLVIPCCFFFFFNDICLPLHWTYCVCECIIGGYITLYSRITLNFFSSNLSKYILRKPLHMTHIFVELHPTASYIDNTKCVLHLSSEFSAGVLDRNERALCSYTLKRCVTNIPTSNSVIAIHLDHYLRTVSRLISLYYNYIRIIRFRSKDI